MDEKTRLELELDQRERYRTPVGAKVFIIIILIVLVGVAAYAFKIEKELKSANAEIALLKEAFEKEKIELLSRFKRLQMQEGSAPSGHEPSRESQGDN